MAPKTDVGGSNGKGGMSSAEFLMACIRNGKEKLNVDFDGVAKLTGMSKGGAANKYRGIIKQMEDEGATWTKTDVDNDKKTTPSPKRKAPAKKAKSPAHDSDGDSEANEESDEEKEPPKKKGPAAAKSKKITAATKKGITTKKKGAAPVLVKGEESDGEEAANGENGEDAEGGPDKEE